MLHRSIGIWFFFFLFRATLALNLDNKAYKNLMSRAQFHVLLQDVVRIYSSCRRDHLSSVELFNELWLSHGAEYLHYAGSTAIQPYQPHVVGSMLLIGVAYATLPFELNPSAVKFGLLWLYFSYFTQPAIDQPHACIKIRIPLGAVQQLLQMASGSCCSSDDASLARVVLRELHRHDALHVVPFVDLNACWQEVVQAHASARVPLVKPFTSEDSSIHDEFDKALADYSDSMLRFRTA